MTPRQQALADGEKYYITGKPCKQGHISKRATLTGTCYQCTLEASQAWARRNQDKFPAYAQKYRDKNQEQVREKDRQYKAHLRATNPEYLRAIKQKSYRKKAAALGRPVRPGGRLTVQDVQRQLQLAHGDALEYVGGYISKHKLATFRCTLHGRELRAAPHSVLRGANPCTQCNHMKSSGEDAVFRFLSIFTPTVQRDRTLLRPRELDIVVPDHKLAIEYCGMYWHSLGSAEEVRSKKHNHITKHQDCRGLGYRLITIYESEWRERTPQVKRLLRAAMGKLKGRVMARKCELRKVPTPDAREFFNRYHIQGGAGYGEHYGLYWKGRLVACMRFTEGINDRGPNTRQRDWTLARYATRVTVAGGASRLFKAFVRENRPSRVKSFSDNRYFSGGMYQQLGFEVEAELPADYQVWSPKVGLRPKAHYQRRLIPARLEEHGVDAPYDPQTDPRTEADMTYAMGARRIYDCGKKRWVWYPNRA